MKKRSELPSPCNYNIGGSHGADSQLGVSANKSNKQYSFGFGRDQMQKLHVDRIEQQAKVGVQPPGPGVYELPRTFGNSGLTTSLGSKDKQ